MLKSYVGIASRNGLERLCPDHPEVARFLSIQAGRLRPQRATLVWAVMPAAAADAVLDELRFGGKQAALRLLQATARECGRLATR